MIREDGDLLTNVYDDDDRILCIRLLFSFASSGEEILGMAKKVIHEAHPRSADVRRSDDGSTTSEIIMAEEKQPRRAESDHEC